MTKSPKGPYAPCATGVHVCGKDDEANAFYTALNISCPSPARAVALFEFAQRAYGAVADEPQDFVVDLNIGGDTVRDFPISHQMLTRWKAERHTPKDHPHD